MIYEKDEDLTKETNNRIRKMKREFSKPLKLKVFNNTENYSQMVIVKDIEFMALCEHHKVAFMGKASIGYIPDKHLIGISKLARVVEYFFNPTIMTIQEKGTEQIKNLLEENLKPKGVMVVVEAVHGCMAYRGVKKSAKTITSSFSGVFSDSKPREEFLNLIK